MKTNDTTKQRITDGKCLQSITTYNVLEITEIEITEFKFSTTNKSEFTICITTKNGESISFTASSFAKREKDTATILYEQLTEKQKELLSSTNRADLILQ